jgi:hypothetical protein
VKFNLSKKELAQAQADLIAARLMPDRILITYLRLPEVGVVRVRRWLGVCGDAAIVREWSGHPGSCHVCRCRVDFGEPKAYVNADAHSSSDIMAFALALRRAKEVMAKMKRR